MKKIKKRRLKKGVKKALFYTLTSIIILVSGIITIGAIKSEFDAYEKEKQEERTKYAECIKEQSRNQGYIIRYVCSNEWERLDAETNAQYKQIKKNLYLVKIGE